MLARAAFISKLNGEGAAFKLLQVTVAGVPPAWLWAGRRSQLFPTQALP